MPPVFAPERGAPVVPYRGPSAAKGSPDAGFRDALDCARRSQDDWVNRVLYHSTVALEMYWSAYWGEVLRDGEHHAWSVCIESDSRINLVLGCGMPKVRLDEPDEILPGSVPSASVVAEQLPGDKPPLNFVAPGDWLELLTAKIMGRELDFHDPVKVFLNEKGPLSARAYRAGSDWSFVSTPYEINLPQDFFALLPDQTTEVLHVRAAGTSFRLDAYFLLTEPLLAFVQELRAHCPRNELETRLHPTQWERLRKSRNPHWEPSP